VGKISESFSLKECILNGAFDAEDRLYGRRIELGGYFPVEVL
jgi:hypothetical protein